MSLDIFVVSNSERYEYQLYWVGTNIIKAIPYLRLDDPHATIQVEVWNNGELKETITPYDAVRRVLNKIEGIYND